MLVNVFLSSPEKADAWLHSGSAKPSLAGNFYSNYLSLWSEILKTGPDWQFFSLFKHHFFYIPIYIEFTC